MKAAVDMAGFRIGMVGPLPPPAGGIANQTRQLCDLLRQAGASVQLVQTNAPYRPAWAGRLPVLRACARLLPYLAALWRAAGRSDVLHVMANSGWSWHLFAAPAIWIGWLRSVPVVVNYRGGEAAAFLQRSARVMGWSLARIERLVVPSGFLCEVFSGYGIKAEIVPNVVDLRRFCPHPRTQARAAAPPHILVTRNLEPIYDNATALRAFARVCAAKPASRMTIAGTGPELSTLQALARELGVAPQVTFAGCLDRDEVAALYRDGSVMLNPSLVDNTPNSVLEALASGVPVVSTSVGGVPFLVEHGVTALLVPPGDDDAMARAVLALLDDAALVQQLREAGLREVQRYTWDHVAPLLAAVYRAARQRARSA